MQITPCTELSEPVIPKGVNMSRQIHTQVPLYGDIQICRNLFSLNTKFKKNIEYI